MNLEHSPVNGQSPPQWAAVTRWAIDFDADADQARDLGESIIFRTLFDSRRREQLRSENAHFFAQTEENRTRSGFKSFDARVVVRVQVPDPYFVHMGRARMEWATRGEVVDAISVQRAADLGAVLAYAMYAWDAAGRPVHALLELPCAISDDELEHMTHAFATNVMTGPQFTANPPAPAARRALAKGGP